MTTQRFALRIRPADIQSELRGRHVNTLPVAELTMRAFRTACFQQDGGVVARSGFRDARGTSLMCIPFVAPVSFTAPFLFIVRVALKCDIQQQIRFTINVATLAFFGKCLCSGARRSGKCVFTHPEVFFFVVVFLYACSFPKKHECLLPESAADGYFFRERSIDLSEVNNCWGLQAVMFGMITEHWCSQTVIFPNSLLSDPSLASLVYLYIY